MSNAKKPVATRRVIVSVSSHYRAGDEKTLTKILEKEAVVIGLDLKRLGVAICDCTDTQIKNLLTLQKTIVSIIENPAITKVILESINDPNKTKQPANR